MKDRSPYESAKSTPFLLVAKYRSDIMGLAALWIWFFHIWKLVLPSHSSLSIIEKLAADPLD